MPAFSANEYVKIAADHIPAYWPNFSEIRLGQIKQVNPTLKLTKYSILDDHQKIHQVLVGCQGQCKDFTCAKDKNSFRLGCVPSKDCKRIDYELNTNHEDKLWVERITDSEIKLFLNAN